MNVFLCTPKIWSIAYWWANTVVSIFFTKLEKTEKESNDFLMYRINKVLLSVFLNVEIMPRIFLA